MIRIIAGEFRGRKLDTPKDESVRPTGQRVRESVFNILQNKLIDARVLDLFAGSGAFGLEALSRGAALAVFVDQDPQHAKLVSGNIEKLGVTKRTKVINADYERAVYSMASKGNKFDFVYVDPPYMAGYYTKAIELLFTTKLLNDGATVIVEHPVGMELDLQGLCNIVDVRTYGKMAVSFLKVG
jgi:16S rRNA (guanine(966)-N(2))-methyltransferase RsmD